MPFRSSLTNGLQALNSYYEKLTEDFGMQRPESKHCLGADQDQACRLPAIEQTPWRRARCESQLPILLGRESSLIVGKRIDEQKSGYELPVVDADEDSEDSLDQVEADEDFDDFVQSCFANIANRSPSPILLDIDDSKHVDLAESYRKVTSALDESEKMLAEVQAAMEPAVSKSQRSGAVHKAQCQLENYCRQILETVSESAAEFDIAENDLRKNVFDVDSNMAARLGKFGLELHALIEQTSTQRNRRQSRNEIDDKLTTDSTISRQVRFFKGCEERKDESVTTQKPKPRDRALDLSGLQELVRQQNVIAALQSSLTFAQKKLEAYDATLMHVCNPEAPLPEGANEIFEAVVEEIACEVVRKNSDLGENGVLEAEVETLRASMKTVHKLIEQDKLKKLSGHANSKRESGCLDIASASSNRLVAHDVGLPMQTRKERSQLPTPCENLQLLKEVIKKMQTERNIFLTSIARAHEYTSLTSQARKDGAYQVLPSGQPSNDSGRGPNPLSRYRKQSRLGKDGLKRHANKLYDVHAEATEDASFAEIALQKEHLQVLEQQHMQLRQQLASLQRITAGRHSRCIGLESRNDTLSYDQSQVDESADDSSCAMKVEKIPRRQRKRKAPRRQNVFSSNMDPLLVRLLRLKQDNIELAEHMREINLCYKKIKAACLKGDTVDRSYFGDLLPAPGEEDRVHEANMQVGRKQICALQRRVHKMRLLWSSPETQDPEFAMLVAATASRLEKLGKGSRTTILRSLLHPKRIPDDIEQRMQQRHDIATLPATSRRGGNTITETSDLQFDSAIPATSQDSAINITHNLENPRASNQRRGFNGGKIVTGKARARASEGAVHTLCSAMECEEDSSESRQNTGTNRMTTKGLGTDANIQSTPSATFDRLRNKLSNGTNLELVGRSGSKEDSQLGCSTRRTPSKKRLRLSSKKLRRKGGDNPCGNMSECLLQGVCVKS